MAFGPHSLRHIVDEDEASPPTHDGDLARKDLDIDNGAVFGSVTPDADHPIRRLEVREHLA